MTASTSRRQRTLAAALAASLSLGVAAAARADDAPAVSEEGAQDLERRVHDWLAALLGPSVPLGDRPIQVTAEDGHYRAELPLADKLAGTGLTVTAEPIAGNLTPLDGGRWAIDEVRVPSPLEFSYPLPGADGGIAKFTATIATQSQSGVFDPSLATPSHWDAKLTGYSSSTEAAKDMGSSTLSVGEITMHAGLQPAADGRLDLIEETDSHLLASNANVPGNGLAAISIERMHGALKLSGVAPEQLLPLMHALVTLAPVGVATATQGQANSAAVAALAGQNRAAAEEDRRAAEADRKAVAEGRLTADERKKHNDERRAQSQARMKALAAARTGGGKPTLSDEQKAAAHDALVALADLISGFDEQSSMENLHFSASGHSGHLGKFDSGLTVAAPDGRVGIHFHFLLDGFDSPDVPPGVFRDYLPRHIAIAPRITGIPAADLHALILRAADSNGDDPLLSVQARALLDKGPVAVGLDELSLDFGPATLTGTGEVRILGTDSYEGEAHFVATGLDALIQQSNTVPELKQAAPVLFLLKGMGKQDGATTVWDVTYRDGKALVNGTDLSGMIPGK